MKAEYIRKGDGDHAVALVDTVGWASVRWEPCRLPRSSDWFTDLPRNYIAAEIAIQLFPLSSCLFCSRAARLYRYNILNRG